MAKYPGGVTVSGYIAPSDTADVYATHKAQFGYGGYRSALDLTARDAITTLRREEGMIVYVISEKKEYRLVGGIDNTNWVEVIAATGSTGTGTTTDQNYYIVQTLADLSKIDSTKRKLGLLAYVTDLDEEYRLVGGILDEDWVKSLNFGGNYILVNNITERDGIDARIRLVGQICYVIGLDQEYRLVGGTANSNWTLIERSSGGTGTGTGTGTTTSSSDYVILETLADVENYPKASRKVGLTLYAKDVDKEYRFAHGIENTNLEELVYVSGITQTGDIINNNYNTYVNSFGCLNIAQIYDIITTTTSDYNPVYVDPEGKTIPSASDTNEFTFKINKTDYWVDDWIYFSGSTMYDKTKTNEVFLEITQNGTTDVFNITKSITDNTTYQDIEIKGTIFNWYGYIRRTKNGKVDLKVYEMQDAVRTFNINKSIYIYQPNFSIKDGSSNTPLNIDFSGSIYTDKVYDFSVIPNTSLTVSLARVNVGSKGIDTINYTNITSTMTLVNTDAQFTIPASVFRDSLVDGYYSLLVTGKDGGVTIPPYFYGPFTLKK